VDNFEDFEELANGVVFVFTSSRCRELICSNGLWNFRKRKSISPSNCKREREPTCPHAAISLTLHFTAMPVSYPQSSESNQSPEPQSADTWSIDESRHLLRKISTKNLTRLTRLGSSEQMSTISSGFDLPREHALTACLHFIPRPQKAPKPPDRQKSRP
jgi:hypothetical protein